MSRKMTVGLLVAVVIWIAGTFAFAWLAHIVPCGTQGCGESSIEIAAGGFALAFFFGVPVAYVVWLMSEAQ